MNRKSQNDRGLDWTKVPAQLKENFLQNCNKLFLLNNHTGALAASYSRFSVKLNIYKSTRMFVLSSIKFNVFIFSFFPVFFLSHLIVVVAVCVFTSHFLCPRDVLCYFILSFHRHPSSVQFVYIYMCSSEH